MDDAVFEDTGLSALEQRQQLLGHHVHMVARKLSHALLVAGDGGTGKSRCVFKTLEADGIEPVLINSHVTPLALYGIMYQYREDQVIFFDDVDSIFGSMPHLGLLRSALWGTPRVVTYNSSVLKDLPPRFETTSRFIFAVNVLPKKNSAFDAVLSRCVTYQLSATNQELLELMRSISAKGFRDLTSDDCQMVIDYIGDNCEDRTLSLRLLSPCLRMLTYARAEGLDWHTLVKSQLQTLGRKQLATKRLDTKTQDLRVLREALAKHPASTQEQQTYWCAKTGKSRASFYRALSRHNND
ncbi:MAG: hypothetical protein ACYC4N_12425 [Pirellulaceae bacterium]